MLGTPPVGAPPLLGAPPELGTTPDPPEPLVPGSCPLPQAIRTEIEQQRWPLAAASLGNRQAFAASIAAGQGVAESAPKTPAGQEVAALAEEVLGRLT